VHFWTTLLLDGEYLWNASKYYQLENGVANYINLVNFGQQTDINITMVLTHQKANFLDAHIWDSKG